MGNQFCCTIDSTNDRKNKIHNTLSRKKRIEFIQKQGFFCSGADFAFSSSIFNSITTDPDYMDITPNEEGRTKKMSSKRLVFSDFLLINKLGEGGFGKVFLVQRKDTKKHYAMKILSKSKLEHTFYRTHTLSEKKILQNINSPFIVKLNYAFQDTRNLYLVLEYLPGGSLFQQLSEKKVFSEEQTRSYIAEIVLALEDLHKRDIVYRDLKPENILLDVNGRIKLIDFGLSKQGVTSETKAYTTCGTAEYMAPDMLKGEGHDKAVDWWSLGCIMYEMLFGERPHASVSSNKNHLFHEICHKPVDIPEKFSKEAQLLLKDFLQIDPLHRLQEISAIKKHDFFADIDWKEIREKQEESVMMNPAKNEELLEKDTKLLEPRSTLNSCSNLDSYSDFSGFTYYDSIM